MEVRAAVRNLERVGPTDGFLFNGNAIRNAS